MTEQEAIEIARRTAEEEGWAWIEPVDARLIKPWLGKRSRRWKVYSNINTKGPEVRVTIDDETGEVLKKRYIAAPR